MHNEIIAHIFRRRGFSAKATFEGVEVSLNRALSKIEIELVLLDEFQLIPFQVLRIRANCYLVNEV